ncbi:hypothetical protein Q2K19_23515 [Micromonospora soli]|uniref:hypothetical protein n=1 Tax=Micromonospora sp. NBRC 110009 TaxID=3061627 RepID=UPI002671B8FB|nr:hypothetical protein [Micromonospora sp. NBRC 110009]WKT97125.1 hypothetical protein Q2K19_23515 [Micromonospora sp. NBRC 110009]
MTGTSGADDGSRAGKEDDTSPAGGSSGTSEGGPVADSPQPAPGRWERWLARARELWTTARRRAKELWTAAKPILKQLSWPDQEPEPTAVTLVDRRVSPTMVVPAQGQVYNFVVRATVTWSSDNTRPELFGWYVDYFQPQATQRLRRIVARCAAEIPPDRPRELAKALEAALTDRNAFPRSYERDDFTFSCEPDVSVHLDEPVRKLLQPYWDQRIALEWERELERQRAAYARERRRREQAETEDDGTAATDGMPEALREERPPRQRQAPPEAEAAPQPAGKQRPPGPRPDSGVELQFPLSDPFLQPPTAPPPGPEPGETPSPDDPERGDPEDEPPEA